MPWLPVVPLWLPLFQGADPVSTRDALGVLITVVLGVLGWLHTDARREINRLRERVHTLESRSTAHSMILQLHGLINSTDWEGPDGGRDSK